MAYEEVKTRTDGGLIPNTQLEQLFLEDCTPDQMEKYMKHIQDGYVSLATAYASGTVTKVHLAYKFFAEYYGYSVQDVLEFHKTLHNDKKVWNEEAKRHIVLKNGKRK